ncbi:MAG: A/G-specific adenine glycosylase [Pseudomonadota bacterium]
MGVIAQALLRWYDKHARDLPWRVRPSARAAGVRSDPYRVWLSEIMLQQTTVAAVIPYFERFTTRWSTVEALAAAEDAQIMAEWAGLGYYARARNLLACARAVASKGGRFPDTEAGLRDLPGIGAYTSAAIAAIAFDRPAVVVDGNVERVMARLHAFESPLPAAKPALYALAERHTPKARPGDHAQAVMDLGATICTPRRPACGVCPVMPACAGRKAGIADRLPAKTPKKPKPIRYGIAYLAYSADGRVFLQRRPERGLLGGMLGLPGTDWSETPPRPAPPFRAKWRPVGEVRHSFTHFHLVLSVAVARVGATHGFVKPELTSLPTVMRKAVAMGLSAFQNVG